MALSDVKKVQTMINIAGQQAQIVRDAVTKIAQVRAVFNTINPDVTGTPLEGNLVALGNAFTALETAANSAVWTGMINAMVPSHRNAALD